MFLGTGSLKLGIFYITCTDVQAIEGSIFCGNSNALLGQYPRVGRVFRFRGFMAIFCPPIISFNCCSYIKDYMTACLRPYKQRIAVSDQNIERHSAFGNFLIQCILSEGVAIFSVKVIGFFILARNGHTIFLWCSFHPGIDSRNNRIPLLEGVWEPPCKGRLLGDTMGSGRFCYFNCIRFFCH